jgi:hypothetical protein
LTHKLPRKLECRSDLSWEKGTSGETGHRELCSGKTRRRLGLSHHQQTICPCGVSRPAGPLASIWQPCPKSQEKRQGGQAQQLATLPFNFAAHAFHRFSWFHETNEVYA